MNELIACDSKETLKIHNHPTISLLHNALDHADLMLNLFVLSRSETKYQLGSFPLSFPVLTISGECMEPKYNRQKRHRVIHLYWTSTVHYSSPGTVILLPIPHLLASVKKYIHVGRYTHICAYIHKHVSTTLCGFTHMYVCLPWYCEYVHTYTYTHHNRVNAAISWKSP